MFPVLNAVPKSTFTNEGTYTNYNFYSFNETAADFWNATTNFGTSGWTSLGTSGNVPISGGFIFNRYNNPDKVYNQSGGELHFGNKTFSVTKTNNNIPATIPTTDEYSGCVDNWDYYNGWNLVGNPYSCAIDWNEVYANTGNNAIVEAGVYFYDDANDKYQYYISGGGTTPYPDIVNLTANGATEFIPAGQGFMVKAISSGDIVLQNDDREHSDQAFWKKSEENKSANPNIIRLSIQLGDYEDETVLRTLPLETGVTENHDANFDAYKMFAWDNSKPQLLSTNSDISTYFAINSFPEFEDEYQIPILAYIGTNAEHKILFGQNTFSEYNTYLEDTYTESYVNTRTVSFYKFNSETGLFSDRFILHFNQNNAPQIVNTPSDIIIYEDEFFTADFSDVFADIDEQDRVTISFRKENGGYLDNWISIQDGKLSGTPTNDNVGKFDIIIRGKDLAGATTETTFSITVINVNDAPEIKQAQGNTSVMEDAAFEINLQNLFTDVDVDDELTIEFLQLPEWIENSDLILTATPDNDKVGNHLVHLKATDLAGESIETEFYIIVRNTNDAPIANPQNYEVNEDELVNINLENLFTDVDENDRLYYRFVFFPEWISVDNLTLTGVPTNENVGENMVYVRCFDKAGASVETSFIINVQNVNDAPIVNQHPSEIFVDEDELFSFNFSNMFTDIDLDDNLAIELIDLPDWIEIENQSIYGTPENENVGSVILNFKVTDNEGLYAETQIILNVENVNDAPMIENYPQDKTVNEDEYFEISFENIFTDVDIDDELQIEFTQIPNWINISEQTISGIATNNEVGEYFINMQATDLSGESTELQFKLKVENTNDVPYIINQIESQNVNEDEYFKIITNNIFFDEDFDDAITLDYSLLPDWISYSDSYIFATPENENVGEHLITIIARDNSEAEAYIDFIINVENTNDAPFIIGEIEDFEIQIDNTVQIYFGDNIFDDIDPNDELNYKVEILNEKEPNNWLNTDYQENIITIAPKSGNEGEYQIRTTATDLSGESIYTDFNFKVLNSFVSSISINKQDVTIYPNPSDKGKYNLKINSEMNNLKYKLFDMTGKQIISDNINNKNTLIDITNYSKGIYTLEIYNETIKLSFVLIYR